MTEERPTQTDVRDARWEPAQYAKFADQRLRPALELLDRVPLLEPKLIVDLGCGAGEVTRLMAQRWPAARVIGIDHSPQMLERARTKDSRIEWSQADIGDWRPDEPPDLIYSNAALHWVEDHAALFPALMGRLAPGGCLAVQMPLSRELPSHRLMVDVLRESGPSGAPLGDAKLIESMSREWVRPAELYYDWLTAESSSLDIWKTEYLQILQGEDPVLEWVRGSGLRPALHGLSDELREVYLARYSERLRSAYPTRADGTTLFPFRRLFLVATR